MFNMNGHIESVAFPGTVPTMFFVKSNPVIESRLEKLDWNTQEEVRKHLDEFHSQEEMEIFINHLTDGGRSNT